jgi:hypothetical protein
MCALHMQVSALQGYLHVHIAQLAMERRAIKLKRDEVISDGLLRAIHSWSECQCEAVGNLHQQHLSL